ncbi:carboxylesterase [Hydrogenovibrio sp. SC-1]|uniref:alpha/beta hydrolase n=1 Tax=Hydrogenovibrio sp. SC-1 TaxID=2065820 RepID=UPI000C7E5C82|nr:carboxylesterase [Hydrogenovibrio sp. SC-1]PLA74819.1 carboxylesterase [Hydrogenovibrio sp. SC-1]
MQQAIDPLVMEPNTKATSAVIWLHGLGADGHDFEAIVPQLALPADHGIRFIFPHAPIQAVAVNGGMKMRAWYDIRQADLTEQVDWQGIDQSVVLLDQWIAQQVSDGIPMERILVAGFSQGGVIALHAGLQMQQPLAGIIALSTYFPERSTSLYRQPTTCPILIAHGLMDPICPYTVAKAALAQLRAQGFSPSWHEYPMQHQVCMEEINAVSQFIQQRLINNH